jgi:hypothetical protein
MSLYEYGKDMSNKDAIRFFLKYPNWHSYASDKKTVDQICYLVNLSILKHNEHNQVKVNEHNARLFLNPRIEIVEVN